MRRGCAAGALMLVAASAFGAEPAPDPARQAATVYLDQLAEVFLVARAKTVAALDTRTAAERRQNEVRNTIMSLIGGLPDRNVPLNAHMTGHHAEAGFHLENVVFESLPDFRVTANVFVPEGTGPFPAVLISPGHSPQGKASDYPMAAAFARAGFVVLTYDIMGEGERLQYYDAVLNVSRLERPTAEHSMAAYQALLMGKPVVRYFINDAMRGIDYLASRPDVDVSRIGAFGCSGGGAVTAYATALDPRIKVSASACFVTTMHHLLGTIGPQEGEQSTPGFTAAGLDLVDWVELAAPRPFAIVSTTEDMFPFAGARAAHDEAKRFWSLLGASDNLAWITGPGRHGALAPIASDVIGFFVQHLKGSGPKQVFESTVHPSLPEDLLATETGQASTAFGSEAIQSLVRAEAAALQQRKSGKPSIDRLQADIRRVTKASAVPGHTLHDVEVLASEGHPTYRFERMRFTPNEGPVFEAVLVTPTGPMKGRLLYLDRQPLSTVQLEALMEAGWQVLAPVPAGGSGEESKAAVLGDYTLFALRAMLVDRTVTGLRIDQAITAADWFARQQKAGSALTIYGVGALGPVALQAAVLDRRFRKVFVRDVLASYKLASEAPVTRNLPEIALPGVLKFYDMPDLVTVLAPRDVVMINPLDPVWRSLRQKDFAKIFAPSQHLRWYPIEPLEGLLP